MILRAFLIWLLNALAEVPHGALRVSLLNRRMGDRQARQLGVFTGSALILLIVWLTLPWIGVATMGDGMGVGAVWLALMLGFDAAFGRLVFRAPWRRSAADFNLRQGGLLGIGMMFLFLSPTLVARWRGLL